MNLNRAVHEDIVAVEILPKKQWTCPSSVVTTTLPTANDDDDDDDASDDDSDLMVHMLYRPLIILVKLVSIPAVGSQIVFLSNGKECRVKHSSQGDYK